MHQEAMMKFYYIREKDTGRVIPDVYGRGSTHVEPVDPDMSSKDTSPRLFHSQIAAKAFLTQWAAGKRVRSRGKKKEFYTTLPRQRDLSSMEIKDVDVHIT
jgi:hypothetical protein